MDDGKYAVEQILSPMRGYHYSELFLVCPGLEMAGIWNTTLHNHRAADRRDSIPMALFKDYSDEAAAEEYGATSVWMETTRVWTYDRMRVYRGTSARNFSGLDTLGERFEKLPESWVFRKTVLGDTPLTINGLTSGDGKENTWVVIQDEFHNSYSACWLNSSGVSSCNFKPQVATSVLRITNNNPRHRGPARRELAARFSSANAAGRPRLSAWSVTTSQSSGRRKRAGMPLDEITSSLFAPAGAASLIMRCWLKRCAPTHRASMLREN